MSLAELRAAYVEAYKHHGRVLAADPNHAARQELTDQITAIRKGLEAINTNCNVKCLIDAARDRATSEIERLVSARQLLTNNSSSSELTEACRETTRTYHLATNHPDYSRFHSDEEWDRFRAEVPEIKVWSAHVRNTRELFLLNYWTDASWREGYQAHHIDDLWHLESLFPASKASAMREAEEVYVTLKEDEIKALEGYLRASWKG